MKYRVIWIPQLPVKSFYVEVESPEQGALIHETLTRYNQFQLDNKIRPNYRNYGDLQVFDPNDTHDGPDGSWSDWYSEDDESFGEWMRNRESISTEV